MTRCGPVVVVTILALAACRRTPEPLPERPRQPRPFVVALPEGPLSLDADASMEEFSRTVLGNVYETLVDRDADLRLIPTLAESWQTVDDRTWVFRLREGVRLQDGRPLTAALVYECLERARTTRSDPGLALIESLEAPDARTLRVVTRVPVQFLPSRLWAYLHWSDPARPGGPPLGTGPYRIVSSVPGGDTLLEAFPGYWQGAPSVSGLAFRVVRDPAARARGLAQGQIQIVVDPTAEELPTLSKLPGARVVSQRGLRVLFLGMDCGHPTSPNVSTPRNPFHDVRVRQAVALAIDREALVKGPLGGYADVVDQIVAPEVMGSATGLPVRAYDPVQARGLLRQAGYPNGFTVELDFTPRKYRAMGEVAAFLVQSLQAVGIEVRPRPQEVEAFFDRVLRGESALHVYGWMTTHDASVSYEELLHTPRAGEVSENGTGYSDPEFDALVEEAKGAPESLKGRAIMQRLARKVAADVPVIPLYRQRDLYVVAEGIGFRPRLDRGIQGKDLRARQP